MSFEEKCVNDIFAGLDFVEIQQKGYYSDILTFQFTINC